MKGIENQHYIEILFHPSQNDSQKKEITVNSGQDVGEKGTYTLVVGR
jgi:hypothetical protein